MSMEIEEQRKTFRIFTKMTKWGVIWSVVILLVLAATVA